MGFKPIQWHRGTREERRKRRGENENSGPQSKKKCSQCHNEPMVGSRRFLDGKWRPVGKNCARAMAVSKDQKQAEPIKSTSHRANDKIPSSPQSGLGRHRRIS